LTHEPVHILLVEDNRADVYLFRKALLNAGLNFELILIEDGGSALAFARDQGKYAGSPVPDLAIVDLSLPKNDGLQILEAIREKERFANMPIVVTSSSPAPPPQLSQAHLNVARYIRKPPDLDEFLRIGMEVKKLLARNDGGSVG
jgi:two-component system, chemotaxis family, response regulator Rcp1